MEKKQENKQTTKPAVKTEANSCAKTETTKRKVSRTWEAIQKWKGSVIINDPTLLL